MQQPRRHTLQDVADAAGLSKAATSYALRGLRGSAETQSKVLTIAQELGYSVDPVARALAGGRSSNVLIVGSLRDLWQQDVAVMLSREFGVRSLNASIADVDASPAREESVLSGLRSRQFDGVVTFPVDPSAAYWADVSEQVRIVSIGDALQARPAAPAVLFNNEEGVGAGLAHLAELGHHRVVVIAPSLPTTPGRPAELLATSMGRALGIDVAVYASPAAVAEAADAVGRLLLVDDRPTALLCLSDSIAFGAYEAARRVGLSIPRDLSILGYDDNAVAPLVEPPLSTFSWDEDALVDAAVNALTTSSEGIATEGVSSEGVSTETTSSGVSLLLTPVFIARSSTSRPGA